MDIENIFFLQIGATDIGTMFITLDFPVRQAAIGQWLKTGS